MEENLYRPPLADLTLEAPAISRPPRELNLFSLCALRELLFSPSTFFSPETRFTPRISLILMAWLVGISGVIDRIDTSMIKQDLGRQATLSGLAESWTTYWAAMLLGGIVYGAIGWLLGGWWYRVRLGWSGADNPSPAESRTVYVLTNLIAAAPAVLYTLYLTARYPDYASAWEEGDLSALLIVLFTLWSCITGYCAAKARFGVSGWRPALLFLILPGLLMAAAISFIGYAYYLNS